MGKLLPQSGHLCRFSQELRCNLCKGKAEEREPSNDGLGHDKLGITAMGETLSILKQAKEPSTQTIYVKVPCAKLPQLHFEMTPQQFRKFWIDWELFTRMTDMPTSQTNIQLYSCADESVQNAIINTYSKFFTTDPDKLLEMIEVLVTQRSNPKVHWTTFASMSQHEDESIQQYLVRLRASATNCNFLCPYCEHDLSDIYIKDQFIRGIANDTLQTNLLEKTGVLKFLDQNVCHAEPLELALQDQTTMTDTSNIAMILMSTYCRQKKTGLHELKEVILALAPLLLATITLLNKNSIKSA